MRKTSAAFGILLCLTLPLVSCSPGVFSLDGPYDGQLYIQGDPNGAWMAVGESVQLTASVYRKNGGYTPVEATWSSLNENILHVTQTGLAAVVGTGIGSIKAEYPGASPGFAGVFGIPNFAGTWTADLVTTACVPSPLPSTGFTQAWCDSVVGTASVVRFDLGQTHPPNERHRVLGSWTRNGASASIDQASISAGGGGFFLTIRGGRIGGPADTVSSVFDLRWANSQLTGTFTYDWRTLGTTSSQGTTSGEVRNGLKQ